MQWSVKTVPLREFSGGGTLTHISLNYCAIVIISDYLKEEEEFEKIIMAIVQSSVPENVTLQQLLEETH